MKNIKIIVIVVLMFFSTSSAVLAQVVTDPSLIGDGTSTTPLGFNIFNPNSWSALQSFKTYGIGATKTPGIILTNPAPATLTSRNEYPPALHFLGTTFGAGSSYYTGWRIQPSSTSGARGFSLKPTLDFDVTYNGSTWENMLTLNANSTGFNKTVGINNTLYVGQGNNTSLVGTFNATGDIQTTGTYLFAGQNGVTGGTLGLEGATSGTWFLHTPAAFLNYDTIVPNAQGAINSVWSNDGAGNLSNKIITEGSFSDTGAATTTFTVNIGQTMPSTTYKVEITPTNARSADHFYVTNKTATTFDVEYLTPLIGTVEFDYSVAQ